MNNILKYSWKCFWGGFFFFSMMMACSLDYENRNDMIPDHIWTDKNMILAYLNDIHGGKMPGWPGSDQCDEGLNGPGSMNDYSRGVIDAEKDGKGFNYEYIDKINFLLMQLQSVSTSVLTETENKQIQGQALFWRAWDYWDKVNTFGGVPLISEWQDVNNRPSLFVPRNKTSECVDQILKDLNTAIEYLPDTWDDANYGRIDKGTAMAFKGRVLMYYASPMFNPSNDIQRWKDAYTANREAVNFLESVGKGLYPDYTQIWNDERNKEVIMVNQFYYPDHAVGQAGIRPEPLTGGSSNADQPILSLMLAFPQKDGSPLILDVNRLTNDAEYNADFLTRFYTNRDDRFYATVYCGGTRYPSMDDAAGGMLDGGQKYWCTWLDLGNDEYVSMINKQLNKGIAGGVSGFFKRKGLDESLDRITKDNGETDWVEIRFAEVLMNMAECANEIGEADEALNVIYQLRNRANVEAGENGRYGVTAASQSEIREALINERLVEFAFEGKRWNDLRRWKRWDILNDMKHRQGFYVVLNEDQQVDKFDWTQDIMDPEVRSKFHGVYISNLDKDEKYTFNYSENHWFYPINKEGLDRNSKLEQNNEWGGTFDPLQ